MAEATTLAPQAKAAAPSQRSEKAARGRRAARPLRQPPRFSGRNGYSIFVVLLKVLLPALAAALILLVFAWPQLDPRDDAFRIGVSQISLDQAESLSMLNPRFDGLDDLNRPFSVTADLATQETGESEIIDLELPKADLTMENGTWLAIMAKAGRYHRKAEVVNLAGDVVLFHDEGFEVRTEVAHIYLKHGRAEGDQPVEGHGPLGTLTSEGFRIEDQGKRVFFTGKSRMLVYKK